jgi:L-ascorbate metabolism protein UlaG (beta-lactamase superfamily)
LSRGRVTYCGHATVLIELDGVRMLTDPVLRGRLFHLRRIVPPPPDPGPLDGILISHAHWDHLDLPSLRRLERSIPVVCPRGVGRVLRRFDAVSEVDVGERVTLGGVTVTATPAEHDGRRGPLGPDAPSLGYHVGGTRRVYFAGDTDLFAGMAALGADLDLALLPVAGWGPRLGPGHLDAARAAEAARLLRPKLAVPIHWGTLWPRHERPDPSARPAQEFRRLAAEVAPAVAVHVLAPGEALELP